MRSRWSAATRADRSQETSKPAPRGAGSVLRGDGPVVPGRGSVARLVRLAGSRCVRTVVHPGPVGAPRTVVGVAIRGVPLRRRTDDAAMADAAAVTRQLARAVVG